MAWRTFLQAHWPAVVAADFFTTEVWTARGLVTYYTAFVIELHTGRVWLLGSTPSPGGAFVVPAVRGLLGETDAVLREGRILLCDRDPNRNAQAERVVRSITEECLDRVLPFGEWHLRRLVREYVTHDHAERNHQGIGNALIDRPSPQPTVGPIRRRHRVGWILSFYYRAA